ncbi:unnamed protein product [Moneuplotes crassus]|uniref:Uncharacterized protein n=1 Tax=Euplotes crassus TaxID=5936 RepID=A0AAD1XYF1_EUPCR|nr:unnamed protein product [Moneuplotes crassus]
MGCVGVRSQGDFRGFASGVKEVLNFAESLFVTFFDKFRVGCRVELFGFFDSVLGKMNKRVDFFGLSIVERSWHKSIGKIAPFLLLRRSNLKSSASIEPFLLLGRSNLKSSTTIEPFLIFR